MMNIEQRFAVWMILMLPLLSGTTFVIQEGGVEVGRYEENDGKTGTEIVKVSKAESGTPQKKPAAAAPVPEKKASPSKVSGRVLNVLTLEPVGEGQVLLMGEDSVKKMPLDEKGRFEGEFKAASDASSYTLRLNLSPDYRAGRFTFRELVTDPADDTTRMCHAWNSDGKKHTLYTGRSDIEIYVLPRVHPSADACLD